MWDRIAISGALTIGAIVLFIIFTAALIILERRSDNEPAHRKPCRHTKSIRKSTVRHAHSPVAVRSHPNRAA